MNPTAAAKLKLKNKLKACNGARTNLDRVTTVGVRVLRENFLVVSEFVISKKRVCGSVWGLLVGPKEGPRRGPCTGFVSSAYCSIVEIGTPETRGGVILKT